MKFTSFALALIVLATISRHESHAFKLSPSSQEAPKLVRFVDDKSKSSEIVDLNAVPIESTTTQTTTTSETYIVPYNQWQCGATEWDKWIAHEVIKEDCPAKMIGTNDCCLAHDICYTEQLPREECDVAFCQCLDNVLKHDGCGHLSNMFCSAVQMFGDTAHKNSKDYGKNKTVEEPSTTTTHLPSTTTTLPTTELPLIKKLDETEKFLFQLNVNHTLDRSCFEESKEAKCTHELNSCDDEGFTCIYKFCECSHNTLFSGLDLNRVECRNNLRNLCGKYFVTEVDHSESTSWIEEKFGLSLAQAAIIIVCVLVSFGSALFWLARYVCRRRKAEARGFINDANSSSNSSSASFFAFMSDDKETGTTAPLNCMPLLSP